MAIDLAELIPSLQRETSPPGTDLFPDATDDEWLGHLVDSFWESRLFGFHDNYTSDEDGIVVPLSGTDDLSRTDQQLIVLFAGVRTVRMKLLNTNTNFRAVAGSVEFETSNSANLLKEILRQLQDKIDLIYKDLGDLGGSAIYYLNAVAYRGESIGYGEEAFWG